MASRKVPPAAVRRRRAPTIPNGAARFAEAANVGIVRTVGRLLLARVLGEPFDGAGLVRFDAAPRAPASDDFDWLRAMFERQFPASVLASADHAFSSIVREVDTATMTLARIDPRRLVKKGRLEIIRRTNVNLVRTVGRTEIDRLEAVIRANPNVHVRELVAKIQSQIDVDTARARLWARDQTLKARAAVTRDRHETLGIDEYIWTIVGDERVRGDPDGTWPVPPKGGGNHFILNGKRFRYSDPPIVDTRTGRRANPGEDYQCRCTAYPVLTGAELLDPDRVTE